MNRKFTLSIFVLYLFGSIPTFALTPTFNLVGGVSLSSMSTVPAMNSPGSETGASFGVSSDFWFHHNWSISPGAFFIEKGGTERTGSDEYKYRFTYIDFAIPIKFRFGSPSFRIGIYAGPSIGMLTLAGVQVDGGPVVELDGFHRNELGSHSGVTFDVPIASGFGFTFDARYYQGLSSIIDVPNITWKNSGFSVMAGITIFTEDVGESMKIEQRAKEYLDRKFPDSSSQPATSSESPEI